MTSSSKYIVVDSEAGSAIVDSMNDISRYIDQRNGQPGGPLTSLALEFQKVLEATPGALEANSPVPAETQDLFFTLAESSGSLLKSPPAEFEPAFNLLLFVLSSAPDFNALVPVILANIANKIPTVHAQQLALLSVLGNLFNILPENSAQKAFVFSKILDFSAEAKVIIQLVPQLPQLAEWLQTWDVDTETQEELVTKLVTHLPSTASREAGDFMIAVVAAQPSLSGISKLLIKRVLADPSEYNFERVLVLQGVQELAGKSEDLYEALVALSQGDYEAFSQLNDQYSKDSVLVKKARVAALARLASSSRELQYNMIAQALDTQEDSVEVVIFDAIKAGLVKGRMNQLTGTFTVETATIVGPVTTQHWDTIEERLATWKKSLTTISEVSKKARNNHELVKSLYKLEVN